MYFEPDEIPPDLLEYFEVVPPAGGMSDTWVLGPEPFPDAHFATFPTEVPRRAILAGTSERGCCPRCLAPWVRQTERRLVPTPKACKANTYDAEKDVAGVAAGDRGSRWSRDGHVKGLMRADATVGWTPSCACDAGEPIPATVLDCFGGSGTTGLVADRLGRDAVLIELNPAYAEMARRRIESDAPMLVSVEDAPDDYAPLALFGEEAS